MYHRDAEDRKVADLEDPDIKSHKFTQAQNNSLSDLSGAKMTDFAFFDNLAVILFSSDDSEQNWMVVLNRDLSNLIEIKQLPTKQNAAMEILEKKRKRGDLSDGEFSRNPPFKLSYKLVPEQ